MTTGSDGGLWPARSGVKAVVERKKRVLAEGDDDRFLLNRQYRRLRFLWSGRQVRHRGPLPSLGDGLLVDAVALGQRSQARLTILYSSTDCLCRCGAPVKNLAHSASRWKIVHVKCRDQNKQHRPFPSDESLRRQFTADACRIPGLSGASGT
jgi:hypothetical protein